LLRNFFLNNICHTYFTSLLLDPVRFQPHLLSALRAVIIISCLERHNDVEDYININVRKKRVMSKIAFQFYNIEEKIHLNFKFLVVFRRLFLHKKFKYLKY